MKKLILVGTVTVLSALAVPAADKFWPACLGSLPEPQLRASIP